MFCANCGNEILDNMKFCPTCGASTSWEAYGRASTSWENYERDDYKNERPSSAVWVKKDFETIRAINEKSQKSRKIRKRIGWVAVVIWLFVLIKIFLEYVSNVLDGSLSGWMLAFYISVWMGAGCTIMEAYLNIFMPRIQAKKADSLKDYLELIQVTDCKALLSKLDNVHCSAIRNTYIDENGNACVQGKVCKHTFVVNEGMLELVSRKMNYKSILERETIVVSLLKSLDPEAPVNAYEGERENKRLSHLKLIWTVFSAISITLIFLSGICSWLGETQYKYINVVKDGSPEAYPEITYEEAFEDFFRDCRWEYFESTEGQNIVEFYGTCTYDGGDGNVRMQFIVEDDGFGELYAMSLNDEIQPELVQGILLLKIFESYGSDTSDKVFDVEDEVESEKQEEAEEPQQEDDTKAAEKRQEMVKNMLQTTDLRFPILFQGYAGSTQCPVMVNDETDIGLSMGTYEQMLASCVDDGDTRYAPPVLRNGEIYMPTRWDVPESDWYMGLLTYEEFLQVIEQIVIAYEEDGISEFDTSLDWKKAGLLSGSWSNGTTELSISIYSDFSTAGIGREIGNWNISGTSISGTVQAMGDCGDIIRVLCVTEDGAEMELVCSGDSLRVQNVIGDIEIEDRTQLTCTERYQS